MVLDWYASNVYCVGVSIMNKNIIDLTNKRFGRLVVIRFFPRDNSIISRREGARWICLCDCGTQCLIYSSDLLGENTRSCGCLAIEVRREIGHNSEKHGHASVNSPEYRSWTAMRNRCINPRNHAYKDYGGRGITICHEWDDFRVFLADMGLRPVPIREYTLDRIDNNGPYSKENCRWSTRLEQGNNRRNNVTITFLEKTLTVNQWARYLDMPYSTLKNRLYTRKWSVERSLTEPIRSKGY